MKEDFTEKILKSLGKYIRVCRQKANLTQTELAKELNVKPATISAWEKGINEISISQLYKLTSIIEKKYIAKGLGDDSSIELLDEEEFYTLFSEALKTIRYSTSDFDPIALSQEFLGYINQYNFNHSCADYAVFRFLLENLVIVSNKLINEGGRIDYEAKNKNEQEN